MRTNGDGQCGDNRHVARLQLEVVERIVEEVVGKLEHGALEIDGRVPRPVDGYDQ